MKIGIVFFSFDLTLPNNLKILKEAKKRCDYLVVGFQIAEPINKFKKTSKSIVKSYIRLKQYSQIDEIVPYVDEQDVDDILRSFKIHLLIMDKEFKGKEFIGKDYCLKRGIEIYYNSN